MKKIILLFIVLVGYFATAQNPAKFRSGIDVTGQADITGTVILQPQAAPGSPVTGEVYYDSTQNQIFQWNGTSWTTLGGIDIQALTQAQYDGLSAQDKLEYVGYIVAPGTGAGDASDIDLVTAAFNLNLSGTETNVQLAIDKLDDLLVENMVSYTPAQYAALTQPQKDTLNAIIVDDTGVPGSLTDDQTAAEVSVTDTGAYYTATDVEGVLAEIGPQLGVGADAVGTSNILDDEILEADLDVTNAPTDNYYLTFDSASGGFTWDLGGAYTPEDTAYASNWDGDTDATTKNTIWDAFFVQSDTVGITGSTQITNMMSITQAGYDLLTPDASTLYVINNASPATVGTSATIAMDGWIMYNDQTADAATITLSDCDPGEQLTVYINRASAPTLAGTGLTFNPLPNTTAFAAATQMGIFFEVSYDGTTIDYYYFER